MSAEAGFHGLGRRILETLLAHPEEFGTPIPARNFSVRVPAGRLPEFILESEAGLLPGEPPARSLSLALPVAGTGLDGLVFTFGGPFTDVSVSQKRCDFLQILLIQSPGSVTRPFMSSLASLRSLTGAIPGYMAHSVGDQTTARIHRDLLTAGFTPGELASAHLVQASERGFQGGNFVAVGIPSARALKLMAPHADEMRRLTVELSAAASAAAVVGEGCDGRKCSDCDEREVCDKVRAVLKAHAGKSAGRGVK